MTLEDQDARVYLGATEIEIGPMGVGTWAWGDRFFWNYGAEYDLGDVEAAFETSVEAGITLFDTAEVYGFGRSEKILGSLVRNTSGDRVLASKLFPYPWRLTKASRLRALHQSLERLGVERLDLYQMHWPVSIHPVKTWMESFADAYHAGLIRAVGVSNYSLTQTRQAISALRERGIRLASTQVPFSLLSRGIERSGLLDFCRQERITVIAYSPMAQGLLTGKYRPGNRPSGVRSFRYSSKTLARIQPLIGLLREIGDGRGGKSPAQVALNWTICKGTVPIPGAKNKRQADENLGALGWRLTEDEVATLDVASDVLQA